MVQLKFYKDDILKEVENLSSVIGANRFTEDGNNMFDRIGMTGDDILVSNTLLLNAWHEIWRRLKIWITASSMPGNVLSFCFNRRLTRDYEPLLANEIRQYLVSHILGNWLVLKGLEESQMYLKDAAARLDNISTLLRRKLYERKSSPF